MEVLSTKVPKNYIESLHENIKNGNDEEVEKFIEKFCDDKHAYKDQNESAVAVALKSKRLEIYELLITNEYRLGPHEDFQEIVKNFSENMKKKLRDIHIDCAIDPNENHLLVLLSKCKFIHTTPNENHRKFFDLFRKAFKKLNEIEEIEVVLRIVAYSNDLKVIFDFDRDSVLSIDPTTSESVKGICYNYRGHVLIGAKRLTTEDANNFCRVIGVMAHEMGHYSMELVYGNNCKPYHENDSESEAKFDEVSEKCKAEKDKEEQIRLAFLYPKHVQHAELIVRVVQLLALYSLDSDRDTIEEIKQEFRSLFDFFVAKVFPDMKRKLPELELKFKIQEVNKLCGVFDELESSEISLTKESLRIFNFVIADEIQIFASNCVKLSMKMIHEKLEMQEKLSTAIFVTLESLKNEMIENLITKMFKLSSETAMIIDCDCEKEEKVLMLMEKFKKIKKIVFVVNENFKSDHEKVSIQHSWSQLTSETQQILLQRNVIFQGKELKLEDLLPAADDSHEIPLNILLSDEPIKVGKILEFPETFYVGRKFLYPGAVLINQDPWTYDVELTINDVLDLHDAKTNAKSKQVILISEIPGMGKTTEFEMISKKLKDKFPSSWIFYVELKEFIPFYQKDERITMNFDDVGEVLQFFTTNLLKIQNFEAKVFENLFGENRVVFLLDGFDEVSPSYKNFITKLMSAIVTFSSNPLYVSTRPHFENELREKFDVQIYWIKRMTKEDRREFFIKFLESKKLDQQTFDRCLTEVENFSSSLEQHPSADDMLYNPLLLKMVAELLDDDVNIELVSRNYFEIFKSFVDKMIIKAMCRGTEAQTSIAYQIRRDEIQDFYYKHALKTIFWQGHRVNANNLIKHTKLFKDTLQLSHEDIIRTGLMCDAGCMTPLLEFVHRTFAEFFVAEFLIKKIFNHKNLNDEETFQLILGTFYDIISRGNSEHKMTCKFLEDGLRSFVYEDCEESQKVQRIFDKYFVPHKLYLLFHSLIVNESVNLMKIVTNALIKDKNKLFQANFPIIFMLTFVRKPIEFMKEFWDFCGETFDVDQIKSLLLNFFAEVTAEDKLDNPRNYEFLLQKAQTILSEDELRFPQRPEIIFN